MQHGNVVSVSWGDHLVFGEGVGRLATPDDLARRLPAWRNELGADSMHWRENGSYEHLGRLHVARGHGTRIEQDMAVSWDEVGVMSAHARAAGISPWLYVAPLSEGWPLPPRAERAVSYHNEWHGRDVAWQSHVSRAHPEWAEVDRSGRVRQWGVLSMAYPEVRAHFRDRFLRLLDGLGIDGLFVCLRSESRPADHADQFGFSEPIRADFQRLHGRDILHEDFDVAAWRNLRGSYLTQFLRELRAELVPRGVRLGVGCARGDVLGPPFGNATLDWRGWVREGLVDRLVIDQDSSHCPSLWIRLWPMHAGYGYVQNYLEGIAMPPLEEHLRDVYRPVLAGSGTELFVARQWCERDPAADERIRDIPGVSGLVLGSFRFDNPGAVARGDWRA